MRDTISSGTAASYQPPKFITEAENLMNELETYSNADIEGIMKVSSSVAEKTRLQSRLWSTNPEDQLPAIDAFLGDIYSGLQTATLSDEDRNYANDHLYIMSGLYGLLRALDSICSYRLEMGYRLKKPYENLTKFWSEKLPSTIPATETIVNLSAVEYTKALLPFVEDNSVISPKFLTVSPKTNEPTFVVVHAKIARGAFAHWMITNRIDSIDRLKDFSELGYSYDETRSSPNEPVFTAKEFDGLGLSVRLT